VRRQPQRFLWAWHFGTVGAMTSAMMALPTIALAYRWRILRRGGGAPCWRWARRRG
jgi:hypothetical protein